MTEYRFHCPKWIEYAPGYGYWTYIIEKVGAIYEFTYNKEEDENGLLYC